MSPPRLFAPVGRAAGREHRLVAETVVGRSAEADLRLDFPQVSGQHAVFRPDPDGGGWVVEDLGSLNGTEVDGLPVTRPYRLGHLHLITFGRVLRFVFVDPERAAGRPEPREEPP